MTKEMTLNIQNQAGVHARPAAMLAQKAAEFKSQILLHKADRQANAKSIISIMGLGIQCGDQIVLKVEGPDADVAVGALAQLVNDKFGEA